MHDKTNLLSFYEKFSDEQACRNNLEKLRWDGRIVCPHCGSIDNAYKYNDGKLFKCSYCKKQFTVRVGTIFEDSKLPFQKWFLAIYLATNLEKGISSIQLSKYLGITQKTAWFMLHRIRQVLEGDGFSNSSGEISVDEAHAGGKVRTRSLTQS